jgi:hypothetical protein
MKVAKNVFKAVYLILVIGFILWIGASVLEVMVHNGDALSGTPYQYSEFNVFEVIK